MSPSRAVRGTFIYDANGAPHWRNTDSERAGFRVVPGWLCFGLEVGRRVRRWRPDGHTVFTPLWRLDKIIAFPYLDEPRMHRLSEATGQRRERAQVEGLVLGAQGPVGAAALREAECLQDGSVLGGAVPAFCEMMGLRAPDESAAQAAERERQAGARVAGPCGSVRPLPAAGSRSGKLRGAAKEQHRQGCGSAPGPKVEVEVHRH